jgi:hypothetical protein
MDPMLWMEARGRLEPMAAIERFKDIVNYLHEHRIIVSVDTSRSD